MTTFLQLQTETQAVGPFSTTAASSGRIKLWLNQAQHWFLAKRRWAFLESLTTVASVSGQADYVLVGTSPIVTDFGQLIDVRHNMAAAGTNFTKLRFLSQQDFDDMLANAGPTPGIPIFYTVRGGTAQTTSATILAGGNQALSLWPVPNYVGSLKVSYFRNVGSVQMTADSDISIVPEEWQPALIWKAASIGLTANGSMQQAQAFEQAASEVVAQAIAADSIARRGDEPIEDQTQIGNTLPPNPNAGGNPSNSPYGIRVAS